MTTQEYLESVIRTVPGVEHMNQQLEKIGKFQIINLVHAHLGMSSETGEIAGAIKKHIIYGQPLDINNILEECGDKLWYIQLALLSIGKSIEDAMQHNKDKLAIRYPEKFTEQAAVKRADKIQCQFCGEEGHSLDKCPYYNPNDRP